MQFDIFKPYSSWLAHEVFPRTFDVNPQHHKHALLMQEKMAALLGLAHHTATYQMHGTHVFSLIAPLLKKFCGDAMITSTPNLGLLIKMADCQAVFLVDPVTRSVANVHVGWRGSARKILSKTIEKMQQEHGVSPHNLRAAVSPSLGPCCAVFTNPYKELPPHLHPFIQQNNTVDFWTATTKELTDHGVPLAHIEIAKICTQCTPKDWFSHRGDAPEKVGRCGAMIGIKPAC